MSSQAAVKAFPPRAATTLILARNKKLRTTTNPCDFSILMVKRAPRSSFMPNMYVFPGGKVDVADGQALNSTLAYKMYNMHKNEELLCDNVQQETFGERVAAIREIFEETGLLLAEKRSVFENPYDLPPSRPGPFDVTLRPINLNRIAPAYYRKNAFLHSPPEERTYEGFHIDWHEYVRRCVHNSELRLGHYLHQNGLQPAVSSLLPLSRWVTPTFEKKRFDTYFYIAPIDADVEDLRHVLTRHRTQSQIVVPSAQLYGRYTIMRDYFRPKSTEIDNALWIPPHHALALSRGETVPDLPGEGVGGNAVAIAPPTAYVLHQLANKSLAQVVSMLSEPAHEREPREEKPGKDYYFRGQATLTQDFPRMRHGMYKHQYLPSLSGTSHANLFAPWLAERVLRTSTDDATQRVVQAEAERRARKAAAAALEAVAAEAAEAATAAGDAAAPAPPATPDAPATPDTQVDAAAVVSAPGAASNVYLVDHASFIALPGDLEHSPTRAMLQRLLELAPDASALAKAATVRLGRLDEITAALRGYVCRRDMLDTEEVEGKEIPPVDFTLWMRMQFDGHGAPMDEAAYSPEALVTAVKTLPLPALLDVLARTQPQLEPAAIAKVSPPRVALAGNNYRLLSADEELKPEEVLLTADHHLASYFRFHRVAAREGKKGWNVISVSAATVPEPVVPEKSKL